MRLPVPFLVRREDDGTAITIQWEEHGHVARYSARDLRLACSCAMCREELTGRPLLDPATVPVDVRALDVRLVGAYAVQFEWSDGHGTGIYPWDFLLSICPCPACSARRGT
jgi:ATP-binding protein involved in chromosome partitioning